MNSHQTYSAEIFSLRKSPTEESEFDLGPFHLHFSNLSTDYYIDPQFLETIGTQMSC